MNLKKIIKKLIPPLFIEFYNSIIKQPKNGLMWLGNYGSWAQAKELSLGYESTAILEKVKNALLKVKNGEAVYERDSVLFNKIQYSFPLLSALMWILTKEKKINIIDFGGSLGSSYFQNKFFINKANTDITWNVVEQKHFVDCGKIHFEDENLKFHANISDCFQKEKINVLILSSVISYLENPKNSIDSILNFKFDYIIIDLTGVVINYDKNVLTVQQIPPSIYKASYPCWFFNEEYLTSLFTPNYNLIYDFDCELGNDIQLENKIKAKYKGYFYSKK